MSFKTIFSIPKCFRLTLWFLCVLLGLLILSPIKAIAEPVRLLALGDSLTAGYGLKKGEGFTDQLQAALQGDGLEVSVINGGVSGDTSAGGLARLDWMLSDTPGPQAVIVELGANDGLRGLDPVQTRSNLEQILIRLEQRKLPVLLTGMMAPPNMGSEYGEDFKRIYYDLAEGHDVVFYPFFLDGVAGIHGLNQPDAIHPNVDGVAEIIRRILPPVKQLLGRL